MSTVDFTLLTKRLPGAGFICNKGVLRLQYDGYCLRIQQKYNNLAPRYKLKNRQTGRRTPRKFITAEVDQVVKSFKINQQLTWSSHNLFFIMVRLHPAQP